MKCVQEHPSTATVQKKTGEAVAQADFFAFFLFSSRKLESFSLQRVSQYWALVLKATGGRKLQLSSSCWPPEPLIGATFEKQSVRSQSRAALLCKRGIAD